MPYGEEKSYVVGPNVCEGRPIFRRDGKECPVIAIETPQTKRLTGLLLIRNDLLYVKDALTILRKTCLDTSHEVINQALWFSAVTVYGKCFTETKGRKTQLHKKDHLRDASVDEMLAHDELMTLRHSYVSHAGISLNERADVWIALHPSHTTRSIVGVFETVSSAFSVVPQKVERYMAVVGCVLTRVDQMIEKQWKSVEEIIDKMPMEALYVGLQQTHENRPHSDRGDTPERGR